MVFAERVGPPCAFLESVEAPRPRPLAMRLACRRMRDTLLGSTRVRRRLSTEGIDLPGATRFFYARTRGDQPYELEVYMDTRWQSLRSPRTREKEEQETITDYTPREISPTRFSVLPVLATLMNDKCTGLQPETYTPAYRALFTWRGVGFYLGRRMHARLLQHLHSPPVQQMWLRISIYYQHIFII